MKVWLVMRWDYSQTSWFGIYDSIEAVFAAYPNKTNGSIHTRHEWVEQKDGSWDEEGDSGYSGYSAELVEVETLESVLAKRTAG